MFGRLPYEEITSRIGEARSKAMQLRFKISVIAFRGVFNYLQTKASFQS